MEVKRVGRLRTVGQKKKTHRMWLHPMDVLKATQRGQEPHIISCGISDREEVDRHPEVFMAFKREHPIDGGCPEWWVPGMAVEKAEPPQPSLPRALASVVVPKPQPKEAPPQPGAREIEVDRNPKKHRTWMDVVNSHLR